MECMRSVTNNSNDIQDCGCVSLVESKNGFVISDHSDHGALKEPTNPCPEWIRRFLLGRF